MVFVYLMGFVFICTLFNLGMQIYCHVKKEDFPSPEDYENPPVRCELTINGKIFNSAKTEAITKNYYYSADCDIMEYIAKHRKYRLDNPICYDDMTGKKCLTCEVKEGDMLIKCYAAVDRKTLISYEAEVEESVYSYRNPFKRKKISA